MEMTATTSLGEHHHEVTDTSVDGDDSKTILVVPSFPMPSRPTLPLIRSRWDSSNRYLDDSEDEAVSILCPSSSGPIIEPKESKWGCLSGCWWNRSPPELLRDIERKFYENDRVAPSSGFYVEFYGDYFEGDKSCRMWTRKFKCRSADPKSEVPIVLLHGMAAGGAIFALNVNGLSQDFDVYVVDLPGFARSSRNKFGGSAVVCEEQFVESIDRWRRVLGIQKMSLVGHSFGGYLATLYGTKHPTKVRNIILADPWGFDPVPDDVFKTTTHPSLSRLFFSVYVHCYPLTLARVMGRLAFCYYWLWRYDLNEIMSPLFPPPERNYMSDYIMHSNMHNPTGEGAFHKIMNYFGWAKRPLLPRLYELHPAIPLTAIYGVDSWVSRVTCDELYLAREAKSKCRCILIENAHHHVYAQFDQFNRVVINTCANLRRNRFTATSHQTSTSST